MSRLFATDAISLFEMERGQFRAMSCRKNASRFSVERFRREFSEFCEYALSKARIKMSSRDDQNMFHDVATGT